MALNCVITDWNEFKMQIEAAPGCIAPTPGEVYSESAYWRRIGDSMEMVWSFRQTAPGSAGNSVYLFVIPENKTIDLSKMRGALGLTVPFNLGSAYMGGGAQPYTMGIVTVSSTQFPNRLMIITTASGQHAVGSNLFSMGCDNISYSFRATVPIKEWSASSNENTKEDKKQDENNNQEKKKDSMVIAM